MSPKDLRKRSDLIITGKVTGVTSIIKKSKIEKSFGIHRDKVFYVRINVNEILKGKSVFRNQKNSYQNMEPQFTNSSYLWSPGTLSNNCYRR